jgi:hypothetical protein
MITRDPETLFRFLGLEFPEDLGQVAPKIAPPRPTPRPVRHFDAGGIYFLPVAGRGRELLTLDDDSTGTGGPSGNA